MSIKKLLDYDIANIIAYLGGLFQEDPNTRLAAIAQLEFKAE